MTGTARTNSWQCNELMIHVISFFVFLSIPARQYCQFRMAFPECCISQWSKCCIVDSFIMLAPQFDVHCFKLDWIDLWLEKDVYCLSSYIPAFYPRSLFQLPSSVGFLCIRHFCDNVLRITFHFPILTFCDCDHEVYVNDVLWRYMNCEYAWNGLLLRIPRFSCCLYPCSSLNLQTELGHLLKLTTYNFFGCFEGYFFLLQ